MSPATPTISPARDVESGINDGPRGQPAHGERGCGIGGDLRTHDVRRFHRVTCDEFHDPLLVEVAERTTADHAAVAESR